MKSLDDLEKSAKNISPPDAEDFDLSTEEGITAYREAWKEFELSADDLVRDIVRSNALSVFGKHAKLADKTMKHYEAWRIHANETTALWNRTWEWKSQRDGSDILDTFYDWLKVEGRKSQRLKAEEKLIAKEQSRQEKVDTKLFREWQLLIVELEAHTQNSDL